MRDIGGDMGGIGKHRRGQQKRKYKEGHRGGHGDKGGEHRS